MYFCLFFAKIPEDMYKSRDGAIGFQGPCSTPPNPGILSPCLSSVGLAIFSVWLSGLEFTFAEYSLKG
jgi:hypothetical protein